MSLRSLIQQTLRPVAAIFIARRGVPHRVHSDNTTNFVGARNELRSLQRALEDQQSQFQQFVEHHEHRTSAVYASLTEAEVRAYLADTEAVLNSRPLTPTSTDPNEGEALTPGHLLIGQSLRSLPQGLEPDAPTRGLRFSKRWQLLSTLRQRFWQAWSKEYVHSLQRKTKWQTTSPNLEVGALVIIHEDNTPPQRWITGRVISVVAGADGKIRVAEIKTATDVFKRPIQKLAALPLY
ncbi:uncharacterized protein LOC123038127 [Drosophila rhopaloa]|uniref:DUF5641 domain-containing protein n=1 Tax=Drosophila rhopaloa TaxID=1041015 RepID=A0ABM5JG05_DRORH|nr:uncharacterized protein LOC123038127 [Drosophila rhopaloa]